MSYWENKTIEQRISDLEREVQSLRYIVEKGLSIIDNRLFSQDTSESQSRQLEKKSRQSD